MKEKISKRKRIYIAVEGQSEQAFIKWIQELSDGKKLSLYLGCEVLFGGGYKPMLDKAIKKKKRIENPKLSILLVDSDRHDRNDEDWTLEKLEEEAKKSNITLCVMRPNLEGWFCRLILKGKIINKPLNKIWDTYEKPVDARTLSAKFSLDDLETASKYDKDLEKLLKLIGLISKKEGVC